MAKCKCRYCGEPASDDIKSYRLTEDDNPYRDREATQSAADIVSEEGYLREARGEAVPPFGKMFGDFDPREQIKPQQYDPSLGLIVGLDFGFRKPVVEFFQVRWIDGELLPTIHVIRELSPKDIRIEQLVRDIGAELLALGNGVTPMLIGCDPAGNKENDVVSYNSFQVLKQAYPMSQYTRHVALVSKANQVTLLKALTIKKRIFIDPACERLARSFVMATPDMTRTGAINSAGWKKDKGIDDPLDAFVYGLINYGPTSKLIVPDKPGADATAHAHLDAFLNGGQSRINEDNTTRDLANEEYRRAVGKQMTDRANIDSFLG